MSVNAWFAEHGFRHEYTLPYTPQQNGLAERFNRTIQENATCIINHSGIKPNFIWPYTLDVAVHAMSRLPHSELVKTPYEMLHRKIPNVKYLQPFGCLAFILLPQIQREKLNAKSVPCVFIGYEDIRKAYRLMRLNKGIYIEIRNVIFKNTVFSSALHLVAIIHRDLEQSMIFENDKERNQGETEEVDIVTVEPQAKVSSIKEDPSSVKDALNRTNANCWRDALK